MEQYIYKRLEARERFNTSGIIQNMRATEANVGLASIGRSSAAVMARQVLSALLFLAATTLLLQNVDASEYAVYTTLFNTAMLVSTVAGLGTYPSILYHFAREPKELRKIFLFFLISTLIGFLLVLLLIIGWALLEESGVVSAALLFLTVTVMPGLVLPSFAMARGDVAFFNAFEIVVPVIFLAGVLIVHPDTGASAASVLASAFLIKIVAYVLYLVPKLRRAPPRSEGISALFRFSLPAMFASQLYVTVFRTMYFLLQAVLPPPLFHLAATAWSLLERMLAVFAAVNLLTFRFFATDTLRSRQHLLLMIGVGAVSLFTSLGLVGTSWLLERYNYIDKSYEGLWVALALMAPAFVIWGLRSVLQNQFVATKNFTPVLINLAAGLGGLGVLWASNRIHPVGPLWLTLYTTVLVSILLLNYFMIWRNKEADHAARY